MKDQLGYPILDISEIFPEGVGSVPFSQAVDVQPRGDAVVVETYRYYLTKEEYSKAVAEAGRHVD